MDDIIEVVVVENDTNQTVTRVKVKRGKAASLLGEGRYADLINLGEGLAMLVDDMARLDQLHRNTIATKLYISTSGTLESIHGKIILLGFDGRQEQSAPGWVERVVKNARYLELVFA